MKGSKEQSFWTTFAIVMLILIGGSGFYLFSSYSTYSGAKSDFTLKSAQLGKLKGADIFPSLENVKEIEEVVDGFEGEVDQLHAILKTYQKPLQPMAGADFQILRRKTIEEFNRYRVQNKVFIPDAFAMGMERYENGIPNPESTGIVRYQLEAIDHLLRLIADNEADEIFALEREVTAVEEKQPDPELTQRVVKYPLKVSFQTTHEGLRGFINSVSNNRDYFFIIRVMRIDNEAKIGPEKESNLPNLLKDKDGNVIPNNLLDDEGRPIGTDFIVEDARVIFGNEKLQVTAVIDLCRFPDIQDEPPAAPATGRDS